MLLDGLLTAKGLSAGSTGEGLLTRVGRLVTKHISLLRKGLAAVPTAEELSP